MSTLSLLVFFALMGTATWSTADWGPTDSYIIKTPRPLPADLTTLVTITADQVLTIIKADYPNAKIQTVIITH